MNYKSKILILGLISKIYATKFSVVSFNGACQLSVGGQTVDMVQSAGIPLYTAEVPAQAGTE